MIDKFSEKSCDKTVNPRVNVPGGPPLFRRNVYEDLKNL